MDSCKEPESPMLKEIRNVKIGDVLDNELSITADALIANPNNFAATLNDLSVDVFIMDLKVANIEEAIEYKILPNEDSAVPMKGKIQLRAIEKILSEQGLKILLGQALPIRFEGEARAKVKGLNMKLPIRFTDQINLKNVRL